MPEIADISQSLKNINADIFSLNPSTLILLFEIDISNLLFDSGVASLDEIALNSNISIFRFHNNVKLLGTSIHWRGNEYLAAPIKCEGMQLNAQGTLPVPKLSITVNDTGIPALNTLKTQIAKIGDLTGAKVTRRRTLAKYIDVQNFFGQIPPPGFSPDIYSELQSDVYFIDRKSNEDKNTLEYELASILDVEGYKLPGRLVIADKCTFQYRGEGCCYEYFSRREPTVHGAFGESSLPTSAPAIATDNDELISDILNTVPSDVGEWEKGRVYFIGQTVFIQKNQIKYYFVAKINNPPFAPPNLVYWLPDSCSQTVKGCKLRWTSIGDGTLPYGGFVGVNRLAD